MKNMEPNFIQNKKIIDADPIIISQKEKQNIPLK